MSILTQSHRLSLPVAVSALLLCCITAFLASCGKQQPSPPDDSPGKASAIITEADTARLSELASESLAAYEKTQTIKKDALEASKASSSRGHCYATVAKVLDQPPLSPEAMAKLDKQIAGLTNKIAAAKKRSSINQTWMNMIENDLFKATLTKEVGAIKDKAARLAKKKELLEQSKKLIDQAEKQSTSILAKAAAVRKAVEKDNAELGKLLSAYLRTPTGEFKGLKPKPVSARMHDAFGWGEWVEAGNKQAAVVDFQIRSDAEKKNSRSVGTLDGKYSIEMAKDAVIVVWVSNFRVALKPKQKSLRGKEKLQKMLPLFVDLDNLAKVKVNN